MSDLKILHNPRCSKSRQTLQILYDKGLEPHIIEYLKTPISAPDLQLIIKQLGFSSPRQLMRKGEDAYKQQNLADLTLTEDSLIKAMLDTPKLIERPIVLCNGQAAIGRPPESILDIL
ncbi:arsenate reductase (glutaredoxin) [Paraglaciecola sp. MB-3u-78]|jgi:arsenate reductase|uniref:arsenate reductase (glutaredoxin) n=1 Tax=Paraglaciecola sp. MB-3u-78 TaxID=2058332 RepID=UPI000C32D882|nr:arsenate reductase (glutaredoxin) [Paraglaciecola sp. MB-3u-78]PKG97446.1 arsenate reductase (glutaredoxin) [Paraglaciecola sp. MB-3u-78]